MVTETDYIVQALDEVRVWGSWNYRGNLTKLCGDAFTRIKQQEATIAALTERLDDAAYIVRAANAFPHLVAALEAVMGEWREGYGLHCEKQVRGALAIARGEMKP